MAIWIDLPPPRFLRERKELLSSSRYQVYQSRSFSRRRWWFNTYARAFQWLGRKVVKFDCEADILSYWEMSYQDGLLLWKDILLTIFEISTVVLQLSCRPGKQGFLSEKCLQNLFSKIQPFLLMIIPQLWVHNPIGLYNQCSHAKRVIICYLFTKPQKSFDVCNVWFRERPSFSPSLLYLAFWIEATYTDLYTWLNTRTKEANYSAELIMMTEALELGMHHEGGW